jgi:hypothetical protein
MSYDLYLKDAEGETIQLPFEHHIRGGTYAMNGTSEAWLNVTYNYAQHFYRTLGERGIRRIYGMTGMESIPILANAAAQLGDDYSDDYWDATEGNAKRALLNLISLASAAPHGVWHGD